MTNLDTKLKQRSNYTKLRKQRIPIIDAKRFVHNILLGRFFRILVEKLQRKLKIIII